MNESVSNNCDLTFRNDEEEETNAHLYNDSMETVGVVHKIGAESDITNGLIESSEYYVNRLIDNENEDYVFLVRGTDGSFSKEGDSGALVFSRPLDEEQNHINLIGMVYGNIDNVLSDEEDADCVEDVSSCFRIAPAIKLLEKKLELPVKFKDNL